MSVPASPLQPLGRKLSARRGSTAAIDPFGAHTELNHHAGRASSSRLTIVRVPDAAAPPSTPGADDSGGSAPSSPASARRSFAAGLHSHSKRPSDGGSGGSGGRLSFANQSFSRPGSRPSSPTLARPRSPGPLARTASTKAKRLAPEEIVRLARESASASMSASTSAYSPAPSSRGGSALSSPLASPVLAPAPLLPAPALQPASFTALPAGIWLPFVDRPAEVAALMATPPTVRLFALLEQTLGPGPPGPPPTPADDAAGWSYAQLAHWLRAVPRADADDRAWVRQARACVLAHSELIWERIKGALGVPPELDTAAPAPAPAEGSAVDTDPEDDDEPPAVSIEPVLRAHTPPPEPGAALGDIGEEDEDAEEPPPAGPPPPPKEDVVQGLCIRTAPQLVDELLGAGGPSPAPSVHHVEAEGAPPPGTVSARPRSSSSSSFGSMRSGYYDALAERGPGHPLFPSSFAQLALAPTLSANKSSAPAHAPPPSAYGSTSRRSSLSQQRRLPLWAEGYDPARTHEYAVTTASDDHYS